MPIYEYECKTCGHKFEFMKIRSDERVECEKCGEKEERKLEQQVSTDTGFQLKGKGWYRDGY
jgi:putative FmdB family regulatory protein